MEIRQLTYPKNGIFLPEQDVFCEKRNRAARMCNAPQSICPTSSSLHSLKTLLYAVQPYDRWILIFDFEIVEQGFIMVLCC